jgi:hypothetical protein
VEEISVPKTKKEKEKEKLKESSHQFSFKISKFFKWPKNT